MASPVDPELRQRAYNLVLRHLAMSTSEIARFDVGFHGQSKHFVARVDYSATRGGGYQMFEGDVVDAGRVSSVSNVLGKGRVTPRFQLVPPTQEEIQTAEDTRRLQLLQLEYAPVLDDDRVG